jgi:copper homeostasis protein
MTKGLEIPVFNPKSALVAQALGANRVELNATNSYPAGGLTPSLADLQSIYNDLKVQTRVMIRPRGAPENGTDRDFVYSSHEFEGMAASIQEFKDSAMLRTDRGDGFVFGILASDGTVDIERNKELVATAKPYNCTFHRAFDDAIGSQKQLTGTADGSWRKPLEDVLICGFDAILTSGGPGNAADNLSTLVDLTHAVDGRLEILAGGGVRSWNASSMAEKVGTENGIWFHSSCLIGAGSEEINVEETRALLKFL